MFLTGLGTAAPARFTQAECWESARHRPEILQLSPRAQALIQSVLCEETSVISRHFAVDSLEHIFLPGVDVLHERFARHAPLLASEAATRALADAALDVSAIDAVIVSTCTGYLCPGLTSYLSERLGLRSDVMALDLVGQGCGAALPNLRTAQALLAAGPARNVLSICVEICSAAMYLDENPGVLISACLFGDGAAAAVLSAEPSSHQRRIEWLAAESVVEPKHRDLLRFETIGGQLRNILTRQVPGLAGKFAEQTLSSVVAVRGLEREQITGWIMHAGGRDVLASLRQSLGISEHDLRWSSDVLREFGNLSSPFVLFVLDAALRGNAPGGHWWMSSFGAGFSCHGALWKVD